MTAPLCEFSGLSYHCGFQLGMTPKAQQGVPHFRFHHDHLAQRQPLANRRLAALATSLAVDQGFADPAAAPSLCGPTRSALALTNLGAPAGGRKPFITTTQPLLCPSAPSAFMLQHPTLGVCPHPDPARHPHRRTTALITTGHQTAGRGLVCRSPTTPWPPGNRPPTARTSPIQPSHRRVSTTASAAVGAAFLILLARQTAAGQRVFPARLE